MNQNLIWRAVAFSVDPAEKHDEVFVYVDAPDRESAKLRIAERLSDEWGIAPDYIEFYNPSNETELRDIALGPQHPSGSPLLECGWTGGPEGSAVYDVDPVILVASPSLRCVLETAYNTLIHSDLIKEARCIGCGCTDSHACLDKFRAPCHWLQVDRETGIGVCSCCEPYLNHPSISDRN